MTTCGPNVARRARRCWPAALASRPKAADRTKTSQTPGKGWVGKTAAGSEHEAFKICQHEFLRKSWKTKSGQNEGDPYFAVIFFLRVLPLPFLGGLTHHYSFRRQKGRGIKHAHLWGLFEFLFLKKNSLVEKLPSFSLKSGIFPHFLWKKKSYNFPRLFCFPSLLSKL